MEKKRRRQYLHDVNEPLTRYAMTKINKNMREVCIYFKLINCMYILFILIHFILYFQPERNDLHAGHEPSKSNNSAEEKEIQINKQLLCYVLAE